jgi:G protein-coupled receptor GPR1
VYKPIVDPHDERYGLNPYRFYVNTVIFIVPLILAGLAFLNPNGGYAGGGAVCWLPIRPIWYRLGLSWIPRYVVFILVTYLSIAVYVHVGHQFRQFRKAWTVHLTAFGEKPDAPTSLPTEELRPRQVSFTDELPQIPTNFLSQSPNTGRRASAPGMPTSPKATASSLSALHRQPTVRRHSTDVGSLSKHQPPLSSVPEKYRRFKGMKDSITSVVGMQSIVPTRRESTVTDLTLSSDRSRKSCQTMPVLPSMAKMSLDNFFLQDFPTVSDPERGMSASSTEEMIEARRQTMIKQLRMNFIYPIVYIALWFLPFVLHCMQFTKKYANNSPPALAALAQLCIASMGLANSLTFLIREKPWEEVGWPDWIMKLQRRRRASSENPLMGQAPTTPASQPNAGGSVDRRSSGSSSYFSRVVPQAEQSRIGQEIQNRQPLTKFRPWSAKQKARERLDLEIQDRRNHMDFEQQLSETTDPPTHSHSRATATVHPETGVGLERNWWDALDVSSSSSSREELRQERVRRAADKGSGKAPEEIENDDR